MTVTEQRLPGFTEPDYQPNASLDERFAAFHESNPWVLRHLERLALEAVERGARKVGVKWLVEVMRWQHLVETHGEPWRLNNSYTSRYARLLVAQRPELAPYIELRELRS